MRRTFVKTLVGAAVVAAFAGVAYAQQGKPLKIGLLAMELLREHGMDTLHSRKLRSFTEPAFR